MKILVSRFNYMFNILEYLAFEFGFKGNLKHHLCSQVHLTNTRLERRTTPTQKMRRLVDLTQRCFDDIFFFVKVLDV
jgi:hypothetical protein